MSERMPLTSWPGSKRRKEEGREGKEAGPDSILCDPTTEEIESEDSLGYLGGFREHGALKDLLLLPNFVASTHTRCSPAPVTPAPGD